MMTDMPDATAPVAAPARAGGPDGSQGTAAVIADVAHALRNHFHRLYYWMDVIGEETLGDDGRAALDAAGVALRSIERLTAGAMALSRDLELTCISMPVTEVAECVAQSLQRQGAAVESECGGPASVRVAIDASHVSRTIEIVGGRLGVAPGRGVAVWLRTEVDGDGWVVFAMHARGTIDRLDGDVEQMLEWAQAERVAQEHGGRLLWEAAGPEEHRAVLLLPVTG